MEKVDVSAMLETVQSQLKKDAAEGRGNGPSMEDVKKAMSHPKAAEVIGTLMEREAPSVQQGQSAPDFILPWLSQHDESRGESMTLSDHFGQRPVALIFGSYT